MELNNTAWWPTDHRATDVLNELSKVVFTSLRQYLEQRWGSSKHSWVESLPLALCRGQSVGIPQIDLFLGETNDLSRPLGSCPRTKEKDR